jgi:hypothetical protein
MNADVRELLSSGTKTLHRGVCKPSNVTPKVYHYFKILKTIRTGIVSAVGEAGLMTQLQCFGGGAAFSAAIRGSTHVVVHVVWSM